MGADKKHQFLALLVLGSDSQLTTWQLTSLSVNKIKIEPDSDGEGGRKGEIKEVRTNFGGISYPQTS